MRTGDNILLRINNSFKRNSVVELWLCYVIAASRDAILEGLRGDGRTYRVSTISWPFRLNSPDMWIFFDFIRAGHNRVINRYARFNRIEHNSWGKEWAHVYCPLSRLGALASGSAGVGAIAVTVK